MQIPLIVSHFIIVISVLILGILGSGCGSLKKAKAELRSTDFTEGMTDPSYSSFSNKMLAFQGSLHSSPNINLYVLQFNKDGQLVSPRTVLAAIADIQQADEAGKPFDKLLIVSYGWNYKAVRAEQVYQDFYSKYSDLVQLSPTKRYAVLCVAWDSNTTPIRGLLEDVVPSSSAVSCISAPFDIAVFPASVWAKAALADKIGYNQLKFVVQYIYDKGFTHQKPSIYLVGHSFGCRILSGLINVDVVPFSSSMRSPSAFYGEVVSTFTFRNNIKGALYILPALSQPNLPGKHITFPLLVAQSRYDHANSFMLPFASHLMNPYVSTLHEAGLDNFSATLSDSDLEFGKVFKAYGSAMETYTGFYRIPFTLAFTGIIAPFDFLITQAKEICTAPFHYPLNTMAQLPFLGPALKLVSEDIGKQKGLFNSGRFYESSARVPLQQSTSVFEVLKDPLKFGERKVHYIDATEVCSRSAYGFDYKNWFLASTLGFLDPVGAHGDYQNSAMFELMHLLCNDRFDLNNNTPIAKDSKIGVSSLP